MAEADACVLVCPDTLSIGTAVHDGARHPAYDGRDVLRALLGPWLQRPAIPHMLDPAGKPMAGNSLRATSYQTGWPQCARTVAFGVPDNILNSYPKWLPRRRARVVVQGVR